MATDCELIELAYQLRRTARHRTLAFREKAETRVLEGLEADIKRAQQVYYHHPKYGADKDYPTKLKMRFILEERETHWRRLKTFNWINANIQGKWSIENKETIVLDSTYGIRDRIMTLSFELASDALLTKLTLGYLPCP